MEKLCSVCAAPMIRTTEGYKCSFCAHSELLEEADAYAKEAGSTATSYTYKDNTVQKNNTGHKEVRTSATQSKVFRETPIRNYPKRQKTKAPKWIRLIRLYVIIMIAQAVIPGILMVVKSFSFDNRIEEKELEVHVDKDSFPDIYVVEPPEISYEMPEFDFSQMLTKVEDFSYSSCTIPAVLEEMFGKTTDEITAEELLNIQFFALEIDYWNRVVNVQYSTENYSIYPEDYSRTINTPEEITLGYNENFANTINTVRIPFEPDTVEDIYADLECFANVKALKLFEVDTIDLSAFPMLTMLDTTRWSMKELLEMNMPAEQIEVLRINSCDLDGIDKLTNLKNLHIDGMNEYVEDLSVLSNLYWLEELTIADTYITDVEFLREMQGLKSLRLLSNEDLDDLSGLEALTELECLQVNY